MDANDEKWIIIDALNKAKTKNWNRRRGRFEYCYFKGIEKDYLVEKHIQKQINALENLKYEFIGVDDSFVNRIQIEINTRVNRLKQLRPIDT